MTRVDIPISHARFLCLSLSMWALAGCGESSPGVTSATGGNTPTNSSSTAQGGTSQTTSGTRSTATGGTSGVASSASGGTSTRASSATGGDLATGGRVGSTGGAPTGGAQQTGIGGKSATGGTRANGGSGATGLGGSSTVTGSGGVKASGGANTGGASNGGASSSTGGVAAGGRTGSGGTAAVGGTTAATTGTAPADAVIVPDASWACGMPNGIPSPTGGTLVFETTLKLAGIHKVGLTQYGERRLLSIDGGDFTGDRIQGSFLTGGLDWELTLSNGVVELEQVNVIKASDGAIIYVRSCGVAPAGEASSIRFVPDFEAGTSGKYNWLNTGKFVGTRVVDEANKKLKISIYDVSNVTASTSSVQITKPAGGTNQPWNCSTATGGQDRKVFTENVLLGDTVNTGAAKRGTRNIIPITGGTTTGDVNGAILFGGADYQLQSSGGGGTTLEARYTLAPSDGEFILVRNCGKFGALVPQFEARADGPYKALNTPNGYVSSDPGGGTGGNAVSITFFTRK